MLGSTGERDIRHGYQDELNLVQVDWDGEIVWRIGPDFNETEATRKPGWIIGQHHFHMIPKGLPGEGNLLVFDNGGWAGLWAGERNLPAWLAKRAPRLFARAGI